MSVFRPANMIVIFMNVLFFMIVQVLFFQFIASKQFNVVLKDKANILTEYIKCDDDAKKSITSFKKSDYVKDVKKKAEQQEKKRDKANIKLMMKWLGLPFLISLCLLALFIILQIINRKKDKWSNIDWALLTLIVGAYITEILFYLGIVMQYKFYGDQAIYSKIFDVVKDNVNTEPITKDGRKMMIQVEYILETTNDNDARNAFKKIKKHLPNMTEKNFDEIVKMYYENVEKLDLQTLMKN